jgi:hypothetical protein
MKSRSMKEEMSDNKRVHNCDSMGPQLQADTDYTGKGKKRTHRSNPCFQSYLVLHEKTVTDVICRGKRLKMTEFMYQTNVNIDDYSLGTHLTGLNSTIDVDILNALPHLEANNGRHR